MSPDQIVHDITSCLTLKKKPEDWTPEAGDEEFEKEAFSCFVTGVSKHGVDEFDVNGLQPVKHGISDTMIENWYLENDRETFQDIEDSDDAMPIHPKCFEVFKKASQRKFGRVDIDGLFLLKDVMPRNEDFNETVRFERFPDSSDLRLVLDQWYYHVPGTEYLAANPYEIPRLQQLLENCSEQQHETVFDMPEHPVSPSKDPFAALSTELRTMLLERLGLKDITNLRLASRSFRQLPQSYFHHLVLTQMPWVWELRSPDSKPSWKLDWYRLWTNLSAADGGARQDEAERVQLQKVRLEALGRVQAELNDKGLDWGNKEFHDTLKARAPKYDEQAKKEIREAYASGRWKGKKTMQINGLRNRRRVWECVEEILRRIERKNEKGRREFLGSLVRDDEETMEEEKQAASGLASKKARYG